MSETDRFDALVDTLDRVWCAGDYALPGQLVGVMDGPTDDGGQLVMLGLDGLHPADALLGFRAPDHWVALGVITTGWAAPEGEGRPSAHPDAERVRVVAIAQRDGSLHGRTSLATGTVIEGAPGAGTIVDALRRALAVPTAPPATNPIELLTALWLDAIAADGVARRREGKRVGWSRAARLHPAIRLLDAMGRRVRNDHVVPAARALARTWGWPGIHRMACRGELGALVTAEVAAWMDEGMLSRWLLGGLPPLPVLAEEALAVCTPDGGRRLAEALLELAPDIGRAA